MKKKFQTKSARVKGICFHPSRPWIITSLHSGLIQIWDYNMKIVIASFEDFTGPVRGVSFHHTLPLFAAGGDDGSVRLFNYKQKRCLFTLKGHIDYVRCAYFHHELPWILSASDDQTMRIWNYQSRTCVNIITGHAHYVMCAQFHPEKNFIVSASLDSTVRIWDFTVLKKKLTESKNLSGFVGIEIECIKILEGHQRGVNWVCFHPTQNIIASSSDDKKIKLWKYTNQVAWEHSTISGHTRNVSCVIFDQKTGNLISNSEDCTTRVWNPETKGHIIGHKKTSERYWMLAIKKNGSLVASGHDEGLDIFYLNKEKIPHCVLDKNLVIFAQGMKTFLYDPEKKVQKEQLYQYTPKDKDANYFIERIIVNPLMSSHFMVQIKENEERSYLIKKKENYLNFPYVLRSYEAKDSCFISKTRVASLQNPNEIHFFNYVDKEDKAKAILKLKQKMSIMRIFSCDENDILLFVTEKYIAKYDVEKNSVIAQLPLDSDSDIRNVFIFENKMAILGKFKIIVTDRDLNSICIISEKFPIQSAFWESNRILFYTTTNHWKYSLLNGQTGILRTIEEPLHLLRKLSSNNFLAFSENNKIFEIEYKDINQIQFKLAIIDKDWIKVKHILNHVGKNNKSLLAHLIHKGYSHIALQLVQNPEEKFALAIQSTNFNIAFEICKEINTQQYWKMLGDQALKQGIYEAYQVSCQKLKSYDKLNLLYSLQGNTEKLQKMLKLTKKTGNTMLCFNTSLFLNSRQEKEQILRDMGLERLAELSADTGNPIREQSEVLKRLGCRPLTPVNVENQADYSNWPHTVAADEED